MTHNAETETVRRQKICDVHVHVGWFCDRFFSPRTVATDMLALGFHRWACSSTSTPAKPFRDVRIEMETLLELAGNRVWPLLWVTPEMLRRSPNLKRYWVMPWAGIKIHGHNGWRPRGRGLQRIFSLAQERDCPILLHTGEKRYCEAGSYDWICARHPDVRVILAHGRPTDQAAAMLARHQNVWVDTAFMPLHAIRRLARDYGANRLLFGSDYPIPALFYPRYSLLTYMFKRLMSLKRALGPDFSQIACYTSCVRLFEPNHEESLACSGAGTP